MLSAWLWCGPSRCRRGLSGRGKRMNRDFVEMLAALSAAGVEFLVVGAYAMAAHGLPRATGDIDIWVRPARPNAERVMQALQAFGAPSGTGPVADAVTRLPRQQHAPGDRAAPVRDHRHLAVGHLTRAALAAQLPDRLGEESVAVQPAARELPAPRVRRQRPAQLETPPARERSALTGAAESEPFEPRERQEAEAVVELRRVDVGRLQVGAGPHLRARARGR